MHAEPGTLEQKAARPRALDPVVEPVSPEQKSAIGETPAPSDLPDAAVARAILGLLRGRRPSMWIRVEGLVSLLQGGSHTLSQSSSEQIWRVVHQLEAEGLLVKEGDPPAYGLAQPEKAKRERKAKAKPAPEEESEDDEKLAPAPCGVCLAMGLEALAQHSHGITWICRARGGFHICTQRPGQAPNWSGWATGMLGGWRWDRAGYCWILPDGTRRSRDLTPGAEVAVLPAPQFNDTPMTPDELSRALPVLVQLLPPGVTVVECRAPSPTWGYYETSFCYPEGEGQRCGKSIPAEDYDRVLADMTPCGETAVLEEPLAYPEPKPADDSALPDGCWVLRFADGSFWPEIGPHFFSEAELLAADADTWLFAEMTGAQAERITRSASPQPVAPCLFAGCHGGYLPDCPTRWMCNDDPFHLAWVHQPGILGYRAKYGETTYVLLPDWASGDLTLVKETPVLSPEILPVPESCGDSALPSELDALPPEPGPLPSESTLSGEVPVVAPAEADPRTEPLPQLSDHVPGSACVYCGSGMVLHHAELSVWRCSADNRHRFWVKVTGRKKGDRVGVWMGRSATDAGSGAGPVPEWAR
jgi:hypothetical protein